jgi:hypothetical protein
MAILWWIYLYKTAMFRSMFHSFFVCLPEGKWGILKIDGGWVYSGSSRKLMI